MVIFDNQKPSAELKATLKNFLKNQDAEIKELKSEISQLKKDQTKLKEKYEFVLETLLEKLGKGSDRFPTENSDMARTVIRTARQSIQLSDIQLLMLLENSKATNRTFAVTVNQLITAFSIEVTGRTLRNKLASLEMRGLVASFGSRPKYFFLTSSGVNLLQKQKRGVLSFEPL